MELLTWFWAFDKRLLCGLRYGARTFTYIWMLPVIAAVSTLAATWTHQFLADQHKFQSCVANSNGSESDDVKLGARHLRRMMLI